MRETDTVRQTSWPGRALLAAAFVLAIAGAWLRPAPVWEFDVPPLGNATGLSEPAFIRTVLDLRGEGRTLHSPSILRGDGAAVLWFEGSREAARDVQIMSVRLVGEHLSPEQPAPLLSPEGASRVMRPRQAVLVLGNTIGNVAGDGGQLLSTVVSVGGWAAASVADVRLKGGHPVSARKLALSPFLNRSGLVRNATARFADGDIAVPAYFELGNAFGLLVRLDKSGRVRATARIGNGQVAIQPALVVTGRKTALAFLRPFDGSRRLFRSETRDGGRTWSAPAPVADIPNPNAPVSVLRLRGGTLLMAFNDSAKRADDMTLALSHDDGRSWKRTFRFEVPGRENPDIYRYPDLARLQDGSFLLTYSTFAKGGIRAHHFNEAWLAAHE